GDLRNRLPATAGPLVVLNNLEYADVLDAELQVRTVHIRVDVIDHCTDHLVAVKYSVVATALHPTELLHGLCGCTGTGTCYCRKPVAGENLLLGIAIVCNCVLVLIVPRSTLPRLHLADVSATHL